MFIETSSCVTRGNLGKVVLILLSKLLHQPIHITDSFKAVVGEAWSPFVFGRYSV